MSWPGKTVLNQLTLHVTVLSHGRLFTVDSQFILWESFCLTQRISEDITAVFAEVNDRLMGGMINYCGSCRRHDLGKHTHKLKRAK